MWGELVPEERVGLLLLAVGALIIAVAFGVSSLLSSRARGLGAGGPLASFDLRQGMRTKSLVLITLILQIILFLAGGVIPLSELSQDAKYSFLKERQSLVEGRILTSGNLSNPWGTYFREKDGVFYDRKSGKKVEEFLYEEVSDYPRVHFLKIKNVDVSFCEERMRVHFALIEGERQEGMAPQSGRFSKIEVRPSHPQATNREVEAQAQHIKGAKEYCEHYILNYNLVDLYMHF